MYMYVCEYVLICRFFLFYVGREERYFDKFYVLFDGKYFVFVGINGYFVFFLSKVSLQLVGVCFLVVYVYDLIFIIILLQFGKIKDCIYKLKIDFVFFYIYWKCKFVFGFKKFSFKFFKETYLNLIIGVGKWSTGVNVEGKG